MIVYIILGTGFEEIEATAPCNILRRGNIETVLTAVGKEQLVLGAHNMSIKADKLVSEISPVKGDYIFVPGGMGGVNSIKADAETMALIKTSAEKGVSLASICAGPAVLADLGLLDGVSITCYPGCEPMMGNAICDTSRTTAVCGTTVTGRGPGASIDFGLKLLATIAGDAIAETVRNDLVY